MARPLLGKNRSQSRLVVEMEELRQEIEQHERDLSTLKRLQRESGTLPIGSGEFVGVCAECGRGLLLRTADRLHCTTCSYQQYL